jgi:photosystem II stability/assembly factor-like uncharacterized protein
VGGLSIGNLIKTTNGDSTWDILIGQGFFGIRTVDFVNADTGWVAGIDGRIYKSTDGGFNWSVQTYPTNGSIQSLHMKDYLNGMAVGEFGRVFNTPDAGTSWNIINVGQSSLNHITFVNDTLGFMVGNYETIYKTVDGGNSWELQQAPTIKNLNSVYFTNSSCGWVVGDWGTILHTTNGGVTFIEEENNPTQPKQFLLQQNYPNPFNPSTSIQYAINSLPTGQAGTQFVTLKVYDLLGREVATLVNEEKPAGVYNAQFTIDNVQCTIKFRNLLLQTASRRLC